MDRSHFKPKKRRFKNHKTPAQRRANEKWRLKNWAKIREQNRAKYYSPHSTRRECMMRCNKRKRLDYPWRFQAYSKLEAAIKAGIVKRGPCKICGEVKTLAKFGSYFMPYEIVWLCPKHHKQKK